MTSRYARFALLLALALAVPFHASAQTLPQSTVDRQSISQLQYQMTQPGVTSTQRVQMQEQISQLQYQINTRPLISAPPGSVKSSQTSPGSSMFVPGNASLMYAPGTSPQQYPTGPAHYGYGSCDADRQMIQYLQAKLKDPTITQQERSYIPQQIHDLEADLRARKC